MPPTETLPTRRPPAPQTVASSLVSAILLHAILFAVIGGWGLVSFRKQKSWGQAASQAGSVQATMVAALPLPPRQRTLETGVLTSETPSPAPTPPKPHAEPPPKPDEVLIPVKTPPRPTAKVAPATTPEPPKHPQPVIPEPKKATTGETAGIRIPQSVTQLKNGTASITVEDKTFGDRYAYYVKIVNRKVAENWNLQEADSRASNGKRTVIVFTINADGTPSDPHIQTRSGSPTLDTSAIRAIQRVEGFGTLPQSKPITVEFAFDYKQP